MSAGIAHEINNPLAAVCGFTSRVKKISQEVQDETIRARLVATVSLIESNSERIAAIVRGLRSFSRDSQSDEGINTLVQDIVNESIQLCSDHLKKAGVRLDVFMPTEAVYLKCRSSQISQVLLNLLINAKDAVEGTNR